ncbi:MAG: redoxin domain-containing protein [Candidatus Staskawiczbacteria bacterium]|nr:redoxin domain-containing protein [Candidatus Staskawiczbacteria bacterium]
MENEINIKTIAIILALIILPVAGILVFNQFNKPNSKLDGLLNKPSPDFSLSDRGGNNYSPDNLKGKKVVLFFSEGLACYPACWNQIALFGTDQRFNTEDTVALSVVLDTPEDWRKVANKMDGIDKAKIVFDKGGQVSRSFGTLTAGSSMRNGTSPGHTYILLDKQGIVQKQRKLNNLKFTI